LTTNTLLYRVPELLRHRGFDNAAQAAQVLHVERRAITEDEIRKLTALERIEIHAAMLIVSEGVISLHDELAGVDVGLVARLLKDSMNALDFIALEPLIVSMQPRTDQCLQ
jgi:hypothetical protein